MNFDEHQLEAIEFAVSAENPNVVITGGAGTGKTTIIREIVSKLIRAYKLPVEVMAPTGKAAARLKDATGFNAHTIHRALMWDGGKFHRSKKFLSPVVIDESSMIDSWLMTHILRFEPPKLVLVGDAAQLPPVGKGQPFHDLLKLRPEIVRKLTTCYRASGAIHKAAQAIRAGNVPAKCEKSGGETWKMIDSGGPGRTMKQLLMWIRGGHFDPMKDVILASQYGSGEEEDGGIKALNKAIKKQVNPSTELFAVGDRVICNKNFATDDLWNGDLGVVKDIDAEDCLWVVLDRDSVSPRLLTKEQMREITHAYCLSVHKSQGSQFRRVFFCTFRGHWHMMNRAMVYTAITRAQEGVCVLGELAAFYHGIETVENKQTVLQRLAADAVLMGQD